MSEVTSIITAIVSTLFGVFTALITYYNERRSRKKEKSTSEKIDRLSNILKKASSEIEELEDEVNRKSQRLKELDEHSKRLETLLSLKEEQVEAIRQELRTTLKENNRSNRFWTILIGAFWFVFGLIVRGFLGF